MAKYQSISFIGAGNVAWHLAQALENSGHAVVEVYSRTRKKAKQLVGQLYDAELKDDLDFSNSRASVFLVAVNDYAIKQVASQIQLPENAIIAHTSGSRPLEDLEATGMENLGVFYPLQTFTKEQKLSLEQVPICIESVNNHTEKILKSIAKSVSKKVELINAKDRLALHVAAVFACNFTNHLMGIAENILYREKMDFTLLKPLIAETINKTLAIGPHKAQTGPAIRGDTETLDQHMEYLKFNEDFAEIYRLVSQHILDAGYSSLR